jgi:hypothetical protein
MAQEPYDLAPAFERAVVTLACSHQKFYGIIGHAIEPDLLEQRAATIAMQAAHAINAETSKGPSSISTVLQRLRTWNNEGRVKYSDLEAVLDMFDDADDTGLPDIEEAISELRPIVQQRMGEEVVRQAIKAQTVGDFETIGKQFAKVIHVGFRDTDRGRVFKPRDFTAIRMLNSGTRLGFGFRELERVTGGGLMRGMAGLMSAGSGGGKTTFFCHTGRELWQKGGSVAYASIELAEGQIEAKFRAGASDILLNEILSNPDAQERCGDVLERMTERGELGYLCIKKFAARVTTWEHIVEWHQEQGAELGFLPELLIVDFLGKLGYREKGKSTYEWQGIVMDNMHEYAEEHDLWVWTGSQPQRGKKERKIITNDDLNDSQGKVEGSDLFISANSRQDGKAIYWWVGKNRAGPSEVGSAEVLHDFPYGRIVDPRFKGDDMGDYDADAQSVLNGLG